MVPREDPIPYRTALTPSTIDHRSHLGYPVQYSDYVTFQHLHSPPGPGFQISLRTRDRRAACVSAPDQMCADAAGLEWSVSLLTGLPQLPGWHMHTGSLVTLTAPDGHIYMLRAALSGLPFLVGTVSAYIPTLHFARTL